MVGCNHSVFLDEEGRVWTVGLGSDGQLGHGPACENLTSIQQVLNLPLCVMVGVGLDFTVCITTDGDLYSFGANSKGQLGQGHTNPCDTPQKVAGLPPLQSVACGSVHVVCLGRDGSVWTFGDGFCGQLGIGPVKNALVPTLVEGIQARQVACGGHQSLFWTTEGQLFACGTGYLQIGSLDRIGECNMPTLLPFSGEIASIHVGVHSTHILATDGSLWGIGGNSSGQLGIRRKSEIHEFRKVPKLPPIRQVACGVQHVLALDEENRLWAWGENCDGRHSPRHARRPWDRPNMTQENVQDMMAGVASSWVRTTENQVLVCGSNEYGQLALGHTANPSAWTPCSISPEMVNHLHLNHC